MSLNVKLLRDSFDLVVEREPKITTLFYANLFERYPELSALFRPERRVQQASMLAQALASVLDRIEDGEWLSDTLGGLGAKHVGYGVTDEMYSKVSACLRLTLAQVAEDAWSLQYDRAWADALEAISELMLAGAHRQFQAAAANAS